eukprot:scaffold123017_cov22-Tisochrysis_lutea.AAC.4
MLVADARLEEQARKMVRGPQASSFFCSLRRLQNYPKFPSFLTCTLDGCPSEHLISVHQAVKMQPLITSAACYKNAVKM